MEENQPRFGTGISRISVELYFREVTGPTLSAEVHFHFASQDEVHRWLTRLLEAGTDFQSTLLPTPLRLNMAIVKAQSQDGPVEWRMMAAKPGQVLFPPFDGQGREVV
jgi:hypothetical protein